MSYNGPSEDYANLTEIRIGWFAPSDPADPEHGDFWWAADLAVREANTSRTDAAPGSFDALPIRLVPRWAPDPWRAGVSLLTRMVYDEPPLAIVGSIDSASTHLAEQVVAKANLPLVSPIASDKTATLAGVSWMFACVPDDAAIARALVADVLATCGPSGGAAICRDPKPANGERSQDEPASTAQATAAGTASRPSVIPNPKFTILLVATTDHGSRMAAREVSAELSRHGITPGLRLELTPGVANADEALRRCESSPAAVIVLADAPDSARLTRALRARFGRAPVFGGLAMAQHRFLELAGPAAEGVRFPLLFSADANDEATSRFVARFRMERHHAPDYTAALAYDATRLLIAAVHRAGPNRARIRTALVQLSPWPGVAGPIVFDGTGQNRRSDVRIGMIHESARVAAGAPGTPVPASPIP